MRLRLVRRDPPAAICWGKTKFFSAVPSHSSAHRFHHEANSHCFPSPPYLITLPSSPDVYFHISRQLFSFCRFRQQSEPGFNQKYAVFDCWDMHRTVRRAVIMMLRRCLPTPTTDVITPCSGGCFFSPSAKLKGREIRRAPLNPAEHLRVFLLNSRPRPTAPGRVDS